MKYQMTKEEKQIYNEVVITSDELKAEVKKYVSKGRNVYIPYSGSGQL